MAHVLEVKELLAEIVARTGSTQVAFWLLLTSKSTHQADSQALWKLFVDRNPALQAVTVIPRLPAADPSAPGVDWRRLAATPLLTKWNLKHGRYSVRTVHAFRRAWSPSYAYKLTTHLCGDRVVAGIRVRGAGVWGSTLFHCTLEFSLDSDLKLQRINDRFVPVGKEALAVEYEVQNSTQRLNPRDQLRSHGNCQFKFVKHTTTDGITEEWRPEPEKWQPELAPAGVHSRAHFGLVADQLDTQHSSRVAILSTQQAFIVDVKSGTLEATLEDSAMSYDGVLCGRFLVARLAENYHSTIAVFTIPAAGERAMRAERATVYWDLPYHKSYEILSNYGSLFAVGTRLPPFNVYIVDPYKPKQYQELTLDDSVRISPNFLAVKSQSPGAPQAIEIYHRSEKEATLLCAIPFEAQVTDLAFGWVDDAHLVALAGNQLVTIDLTSRQLQEEVHVWGWDVEARQAKIDEAAGKVPAVLAIQAAIERIWKLNHPWCHLGVALWSLEEADLVQIRAMLIFNKLLPPGSPLTPKEPVAYVGRDDPAENYSIRSIGGRSDKQIAEKPNPTIFLLRQSRTRASTTEGWGEWRFDDGDFPRPELDLLLSPIDTIINT